MTAVLASGYGVMFTVLDDFRDEYGIEEYWLGRDGRRRLPVVVRVPDRCWRRSPTVATPAQLVLWGLVLNVVGLLGMAFGEVVSRAHRWHGS